MILGQLRMGARQAKNAPLIWTVPDISGFGYPLPLGACAAAAWTRVCERPKEGKFSKWPINWW